jgi:hypothetical protein
MNTDEYIKLAKHLDSIGAYSAADVTEKNMVKTAADEPQRDVSLQGQEPGGGFGNSFRRTLDRSMISLTKFKDREEYIDESFKALNSYLAYAAGVGFTGFANKLKEAKKELLVVAKRMLGRGSTAYTPPTGTTPAIMTALARASNVDAQGNFLDWSQSQAQIYVGNTKYYNYIYYLREAEVEITKKANPNFTPGGIANTPVAITARRPRGGAPALPSPASPAAAAAAAIGSAGTYPGGSASSTPARTPPTRSVMPGTPINEALAKIVFTKLKSMDSTVTDSDVHKSLRPEQNLAGYKFIGDDPSRIAEFKAAIDATRYSAAKKQKLKKLLDKKIEDARNMAIQTATNPPAAETTSGPTSQPSTATTTDAPLSEFPSERTGNVAELDLLISDLERKATLPDKNLFKNSFNTDFRLISETFNRLRPNMKQSTAAIYDNKLTRLELAFVRAINE